MGLLFLIDIADAIRLVFSLNDGIIFHHMMILLYYLMMVGLTEPSSGLIIHLLKILSKFMLMVGSNQDFQWRPIIY